MLWNGSKVLPVLALQNSTLPCQHCSAGTSQGHQICAPHSDVFLNQLEVEGHPSGGDGGFHVNISGPS